MSTTTSNHHDCSAYSSCGPTRSHSTSCSRRLDRCGCIAKCSILDTHNWQLGHLRMRCSTALTHPDQYQRLWICSNVAATLAYPRANPIMSLLNQHCSAQFSPQHHLSVFYGSWSNYLYGLSGSPSSSHGWNDFLRPWFFCQEHIVVVETNSWTSHYYLWLCLIAPRDHVPYTYWTSFHTDGLEISSLPRL